MQGDKSTALKKRLLLHVDEDENSDGDSYTNPVAKQDTEKMKYVPPQLNIGAINDSMVNDMDTLRATPRSHLSKEERNAVDREAVLDAIAAKRDPDQMQKIIPKAGETFKPPKVTRLTVGDVEN